MEKGTALAQHQFIDLNGTFYQLFLKRLHDILQPKTYFEIGTLNGDTLKLADCSSISVDPMYQIASDVLGKKPSCQFFQVGSDEFFRKHDPERILGDKIDLAFLDGMHLFEFLLRDFTNIERYCARNSVVVLHDCVPGDEFIAVRSPNDPDRQKSSRPGYWTGDVWKILPALKAFRPDLRIVVVDAPPTALVLITNLDAQNDVLLREYQTILDRYLHLDLGTYGVERFHKECEIVSTESLKDVEDLPFLFSRQRPTAVAAENSKSFFFRSALNLGSRGFVDDPDVGIAVEGTGQVRQLSRSGPSFHDDPDGAQLFGRLDTATIPHSPTFVVTASNLRQVGYRWYLTRAGNAFTDEALVNDAETKTFLSRFGSDDRFLNEESGLRATERADAFAFEAGERPLVRLEGESVSLCSFEPSNYGSFLFRVMPKLAGRDLAAGHRKIVVPLYTQSSRDLLAMAGINADRLVPHDIHKVYEFEKVIIPSLRNPHVLLDDETLRFYASLRERYGSRTGAKKLFVSRRGWTGSYAAKHRVMLNEEQLADRLTAEGFEVVTTHEMSARQQIEAFSSADLIVGASGSAMFNVMFSQPGTRLINIESEPHWIFAHMNLYGSCRLDYGIIEAKAQDKDWSVPHKPFTVNVDAVMARVLQH